MEPKKKCPYCGQEILAVAKKCKHCGRWLEEGHEETMTCPVCGETIKGGSKTCPVCKEPLTQEKEPAKVEQPLESEEEHMYCRKCKTKLDADADGCAKCGCNDPFFIKRIRFVSFISWAISVVPAYFATSYLADQYREWDTKFRYEWMEMAAFIVAFLVIMTIITKLVNYFFFDLYVHECGFKMTKICSDKKDEAALLTWEAKVREIYSLSNR